MRTPTAVFNVTAGVALGIAAAFGGGLWFLGLAWCAIGFVVLLASAGDASDRRWRACLSGLPVALVLGLLTSSRLTSAAAGIVVFCIVVGATALAWAIVVFVRRRRPQRTAAAAGSGLRRWVSWVSTLVVVAVLLTVDGVQDAQLRRHIEPCPELRGEAEGATRDFVRMLGSACDVWNAVEPTEQEASGVHVAVYASEALSPEVPADVAAIVDHHVTLLGRPRYSDVAVLAVEMAGPVRGRAGLGFVLIDPQELRRPRQCSLFRSSAGTQGTCGSWVVAHELAHQWFSASSYVDAPSFRGVVWEGTADYLAFDWWRERHGAADAERLVAELFDGRMGLARDFAAAHAPSHPPSGMGDSEERALIYGKASASWIALERVVGIELTHQVLRAVFDAGRRPAPTLEVALAAASRVDPRAGLILRQWWTATTFEPRLAPDPR